jgi:hypothetical protein
MAGESQTTGCQANAVHGILCGAAVLLVTGLFGCSPLDYLPPEKLPYTKLAIPYSRTRLKTSVSLDVLNVARDPDYQFEQDKVEQPLLTQSDTVIAYSARSADGLKTWLDMIVFDEFRMTASRKYFFCIDEKAEVAPTEPKYYLIPPRRGILFDSEFIIDPEVLTTPFATDEAQKTAIIKWLSEQFKADVAALVGSPEDPVRGSELIAIAAMMVRQVFMGILIELDKMPGLARNLDRPRGIAFPHISLDEGRIRLVIENDVAVMKIRVNLPMVPLREQ